MSVDQQIIPNINYHLTFFLSLNWDVIPNVSLMRKFVPLHLLLKCLYSARTLHGHVFVLVVTISPLSTMFLLFYGTVPIV